ncbi:MAG: NTP transferase domain-containing protein [Rhodothermaceae bacterium]|nr:NTP transferase domain-containing protein [Rhodothermaceae bacterium]
MIKSQKMKKPALVILAAGLGSRYGGLKQLEAIGPGGETIIDYSVYDAMQAGYGRVVFVIKKEMEEAFRDRLLSRFEHRVETACAFQDLSDLPPGFTLPEGREKPWGTTHAVLAAEGLVDEPFSVINADDFYGSDAYRQMAAFLNTGANPPNGGNSHAMVGYRLANTLSEHGTVSRGVCETDEAGSLITVVEHTKISRENGSIISHAAQPPVELKDNDLVSMNFWGFTPDLFPLLQDEFISFLQKNSGELTAECYLPVVVNRLIRQKKVSVKVLDSTADWFGITYNQDRDAARENMLRKIRSGEYPRDLWA